MISNYVNYNFKPLMPLKKKETKKEKERERKRDTQFLNLSNKNFYPKMNIY